jgi:hypothetical protein
LLSGQKACETEDSGEDPKNGRQRSRTGKSIDHDFSEKARARSILFATSGIVLAIGKLQPVSGIKSPQLRGFKKSS